MGPYKPLRNKVEFPILTIGRQWELIDPIAHMCQMVGPRQVGLELLQHQIGGPHQVVRLNLLWMFRNRAHFRRNNPQTMHNQVQITQDYNKVGSYQL